MLIPKGDWVVVVRGYREDPWNRGRIIRGGLTEQQARSYAKQFAPPGMNCWPMALAFY